MKTKIVIPKELIEKTDADIKAAIKAQKDPWDKETRENWKEKMNS